MPVPRGLGENFKNEAADEPAPPEIAREGKKPLVSQMAAKAKVFVISLLMNIPANSL